MEISHFPAFPALFFVFGLFFLAFPMMVAASWFAFSRGCFPIGPTPWTMMSGPFHRYEHRFGDEPDAKGSGSRAFDVYRAETLARLDEEEKAFAAFRERLRAARDRAEFDSYLSEGATSASTAFETRKTETDT